MSELCRLRRSKRYKVHSDVVQMAGVATGCSAGKDEIAVDICI